MNEDIRFHRSAIQWRRDMVLSKLSQGYNQSQIARELQIHPSTISLDCQYLRLQSAQNLQSHIEEIIPMRYSECEEALKTVLRRAFEISNNPNSKTSEVLQSLALVSDTVGKLMNLSTDEKTIAQAIAWVAKQKESLQQEPDAQVQSVDFDGSSSDSDGTGEEELEEEQENVP